MKLIIFYSGDGSSGGACDPENFFGYDKANLMLTYFNSVGKKKPEIRFRRYAKKRKQKK